MYMAIACNELINKPYQEFDLTEDQVKEIIKCSKDPIYFITNYVRVQSQSMGSVLFDLYDYQKRVVNGIHEHNRAIILQGRQSGKTITIVSYLLWYTIFVPDTIAGVASFKGEAAKEIIERFKYGYEGLPNWLKPGVKSYNVFDVARVYPIKPNLFCLIVICQLLYIC